MKKILALVLTLALMLTLFAGCGSKTPAAPTAAPAPTGTNNETPAATEAAPTEAAKKDPVWITISYPCLVIVPSPDSVVAVEDAVNAHLEEIDSPVRLHLDAVDANSYATTIDMKQIGGEPVDLYCALGTMGDQVASNKVLPITDYVDTALKPTLDITGKAFLGSTTFNGEVMGLGVYRTDVMTEYLIIEADVANNELDLHEGDFLTMDQVNEVLAKLKELHPDKITMGVRPGANGSPNNFQLQTIYAGPDYFKVSDMGSGACVVGDELKVQNTYATDYFMQVCKTAYEWNQAGYVNKDCSVVTEEGYDLMKADRCMSYIIGYGGCDPQTSNAEKDTTHGKSVIYFPIETSMNKPSGLAWCVSYGCKDVEAACEALNLLYTDAFVLNTILYGVEGRDYVDTGLGNGDDKVVNLPDGMTMFDVPYYSFFTCGIIGNEYLDWQRPNADGEVVDRRPAHQKTQNEAVVSPIYGFTLDTAPIKNQVAAVSNIETQYLGMLYCGEVDPEVVIPQMLAEMEAAGINDIVAEAQRQLDTWAAANK